MTHTETEREHVNDDSAGAVNLSLHRRCREGALLALLLVAARLEDPAGGPVSVNALAAVAGISHRAARHKVDLAVHLGWLRELVPSRAPSAGQFGARPAVMAVTPAGWKALREAAAAAEARAAHFRAVAGRAVALQQRGAA